MIVGHGDYRYERVDGWGKGPDGYSLGVASGVYTDSQARVYVVDREPNPAIVVFDRAGQFITTWGQTVFSLPHEIWIGPDDRVYVADCGDHTVRVCRADGEVLQTLGCPGQAGAAGKPFNMPTRAAASADGEIYVSDGYRQAYVHRFAPDGALVQTWGGLGSGLGQFSLPHNVFVAPDGRVLVADREPSHRIQLFDPAGRFLSEWPGRLFPCGLHIDPDGIVYIAEGGGVSIFNLDGRLLSRWSVTGGPEDVMHGAHGICVDRYGDVYVAEVGAANLLHKYARV